MERSRCWLLVCFALACEVRERPTSLERDVPFACDEDTDCPAGSCLTEFGICTRSTGRLETLLFEVTPQPSDPVYGGARFLTKLDVSEAPKAGERLELNVRPRVPVTGQVVAAPEQQACLSPGQRTLRVALTFTPRERLLGLSVPSYEFETPSENVQEYVFRGSLPPGRYDVYMRPITDASRPDCLAIPQLFRDRAVGLMQPSGDRLELEQPRPSTLRLKVAWRDDLEGWRLDVVHPVSGQVLSTEAVLHAEDVDRSGPVPVLEATLNYSRQDPIAPPGVDPTMVQADEIVRLRPPDGVTAGTIVWQRYGLELSTPGEGSIGNVSSFGDPIAFQAWVWKRDADDTPVPGRVEFAALQLDEVADGVFASFEASATVDATGQVNARLLPGRYRVRVTPPGLEMANLGLMTGYEKLVTVWPASSQQAGPDMQGGHVIDVPVAQNLAGRVIADTDDIPLRRVDIRATATHPGRNLCALDSSGMPAANCERPRAPVLQRALAEDPFIPRERNGLSDSDGNFSIRGLDCGRCDEAAPTYFDLTVRPDAATGLPWSVRLSVDPVRDAPDIRAKPLRIPMPVARPMRVTYGDARPSQPGTDSVESAEEQKNTLFGALVRVFAILDNQGHLVTDPEGLDECLSVSTPDGSRCLQSLIQVAEARTGSDGEFLLLLPPDVE
ncbi:MAG TPA: carboxypeptidase-like regulatory domain-containing protein [Polyangiaceae bacterium]|nr:carboxypeptidase-like regulatory domain-containing protein [Polyangiaceae bacterium]